MNENINLCKILKDCPKGTKLYSFAHGTVTLQEVQDKKIIVCDYCNHLIDFSKDGRYCPHIYKKGECILFPSREVRDWSKWACLKPKFNPNTLKPFDKILVRDANDREWNAVLFSHNNTKGKVIVAGYVWTQVIPYNNETKHLVGTPGEPLEYYKYWEI